MWEHWTTKGNRDAGSSCSCNWGLPQYLRNFGGGLNPPSVCHCPKVWKHVAVKILFIKKLCSMVICVFFLYSSTHNGMHNLKKLCVTE